MSDNQFDCFASKGKEGIIFHLNKNYMVKVNWHLVIWVTALLWQVTNMASPASPNINLSHCQFHSRLGLHSFGSFRCIDQSN